MKARNSRRLHFFFTHPLLTAETCCVQSPCPSSGGDQTTFVIIILTETCAGGLSAEAMESGKEGKAREDLPRQTTGE